VPVVTTQPSAAAAVSALRAAGFTNVGVVDTAGNEADPSQATAILGTEPPAGSRADANDRILLVIQVPEAPTPGGGGGGGNNARGGPPVAND
jgi:serine/threonine-protein kinase